jgi:RHS repeat-associated protein
MQRGRPRDDAFGNIVSQTDSAYADRFMFAGMQYDATTGLYYDHARNYDSVIGRFTSQDPLGFAAGDTNLYRYVGNAPTDGTDASGEDDRKVQPEWSIQFTIPFPNQVGPGGISNWLKQGQLEGNISIQNFPVGGKSEIKWPIGSGDLMPNFNISIANAPNPPGGPPPLKGQDSRDFLLKEFWEQIQQPPPSLQLPSPGAPMPSPPPVPPSPPPQRNIWEFGKPFFSWHEARLGQVGAGFVRPELRPRP